MIHYGKLFLRERKIEEARKQILTAKKYSSNPEIFIDLGFFNFTENNIEEAENNLLLAKYVVPSYFKARHALLQLYGRTNQLKKAIDLSNEVLILPFNENNQDALRARNLATTILNQQTP